MDDGDDATNQTAKERRAERVKAERLGAITCSTILREATWLSQVLCSSKIITLISNLNGYAKQMSTSGKE